MRDYQLVSPSLDGILYHDSVVYEGIHRPAEILRILDGPNAKGNKKDSSIINEHREALCSEQDHKVIEQYFNDVYGVFMKKLSHFIVEPEPRPDDTVTLQAMLQEMIKIKKFTTKQN
ncbi:MAG: hypothetical protein AAB470_00945 [Patescibacteria group bacterium]